MQFVPKLLMAGLIFFTTQALFCNYPMPNGIADYIKLEWHKSYPISVNYVERLPQGILPENYSMPRGTRASIVFAKPEKGHVPDLVENIRLEELKIGEATSFAHAKTYPLCMTCCTYCIDGKCGFNVVKSAEVADCSWDIIISESDGTETERDTPGPRIDDFD